MEKGREVTLGFIKTVFVTKPKNKLSWGKVAELNVPRLVFTWRTKRETVHLTIGSI